MEFWERSENWPECTQIIHWKMQVTKGNLNFTCLENALFELILRTKICRHGWDTTTLRAVVSLWRTGKKSLRVTVCFLDRAVLQCHGRVKALGHLLTLLTAASTQACWEFAFFRWFTFSIERKITHFYLVVVQKRQRNVQKRLNDVQICCFAY